MDYFPKKPVKSFLDLEVYQKALEMAVFVSKYIVPLPILLDVEGKPSKGQKRDQRLNEKATSALGRPLPKLPVVEHYPLGTVEDLLSKTGSTSAAERLIFQSMLPCALGLPHLIAEAHSFRFGSQQECLILLEKAMLHCNKMIVYLEETRDIIDTGVEWEKFDELIKKYLLLRRKLLNLQRSWKKYMSEK